MLMRTRVLNPALKRIARRGSVGIPASHHFVGSIEMIGAPMNFTRNAEIYGEDEPADYLYKVLTGAVRTSKILADGRRQVGAFYLPGDIFGLEVGNSHALSAEAISNSRVLVIKRSAAIRLADRDGDVARQLWTVAGRELARVQDHMVLLVKTAQERVAGFLLEMTQRAARGNTVELFMSRRDIADYLGLTIETVSRTFTSLESEGAIELPTSRCVVLRDWTALRRLNA